LDKTKTNYQKIPDKTSDCQNIQLEVDVFRDLQFSFIMPDLWAGLHFTACPPLAEPPLFLCWCMGDAVWSGSLICMGEGTVLFTKDTFYRNQGVEA